MIVFWDVATVSNKSTDVSDFLTASIIALMMVFTAAKSLNPIKKDVLRSWYFIMFWIFCTRTKTISPRLQPVTSPYQACNRIAFVLLRHKMKLFSPSPILQISLSPFSEWRSINLLWIWSATSPLHVTVASAGSILPIRLTSSVPLTSCYVIFSMGNFIWAISAH